MSASGKIYSAKYLISDILAAMLAWMLLYFIRRILLHETIISNHALFLNNRFWWGLTLIPLGWICLHTLLGAYRSFLTKSRINELGLTLVDSLIGSLVVFFLIVINDPQHNYTYYYKAYSVYLLSHSIFTWIGRWLILQQLKNNILRGVHQFPTLLLGSPEKAAQTFEEMHRKLALSGFHLIGFINTQPHPQAHSFKKLPDWTSTGNMEQILQQHTIKGVVIAMDSDQKQTLQTWILRLSEFDLSIKIAPDLEDILSGRVRTSNVFGAVLIDVPSGLMPIWQQNIKQLIDIFLSIFTGVFLAPFLLYVAIKVRLSSPGPIFYKQERVGIKGRKFWIYKFRSMYENAEPDGPLLSSQFDARITHGVKRCANGELMNYPKFITFSREI